MNNQLEFVARLTTAGFWVLAMANLYLAFIPSPYGMVLTGLAVLILVVHLVEVGIFLAKYKSQSKNLSLDVLQVLIFGVFHLKRFQ